MNLRLSPLQTQRQILAPMLQQSISVLLLPHVDLCMAIEQELQNNPLLEAELAAVRPFEEKDLRSRIDSLNNIPTASREVTDDEETEDRPIQAPESLEDFLLKQLHIEVLDPVKVVIGEFIIGNIDEDGFLLVSVPDIAECLGLQDVTMIEEVLKIIQHFEPLGIASRNLSECLLIQLEAKECDLKDAAQRVISEHLEDLGQKRYTVLSRKLGITVAEVKTVAHIIASLEPRPARNYRAVKSNIYITPDICIRKNEDGEFVVEGNAAGIPTLRINQVYRKFLDRPNISEQERNFILDKLSAAMNFIKSVQQRGQTLTAITQYVLSRQRGFFEGAEPTIAPLLLKEVAVHLDRSESTISRAINNKYVDTPQGLFPLRFFFSHAVNKEENGSVSARTICDQIQQLIREENKTSPLSDQDIQTYFNAKGLHLARRTVAKYRQAMRIPPSHLRKE